MPLIPALGSAFTVLDIGKRILSWVRPPLTVIPKSFSAQSHEWDTTKTVVLQNRDDRPYFDIWLLITINKGDAEFRDIYCEEKTPPHEKRMGPILANADNQAMYGKYDGLNSCLVRIAYIEPRSVFRLFIKVIRSGLISINVQEYMKESVSQHSKPGAISMALTPKLPKPFTCTSVNLKMRREKH